MDAEYPLCHRVLSLQLHVVCVWARECLLLEQLVLPWRLLTTQHYLRAPAAELSSRTCPS